MALDDAQYTVKLICLQNVPPRRAVSTSTARNKFGRTGRHRKSGSSCGSRAETESQWLIGEGGMAWMLETLAGSVTRKLRRLMITF